MRLLLTFLVLLVISSCETVIENDPMPVNWDNRKVEFSEVDSLLQRSYLSVYSSVYSLHEHKTHKLTATLSIRNTDLQDTLHIKTIDYYNTKGVKIRSYTQSWIRVLPMETIEVVIRENDDAGGTGANFILEWQNDTSLSHPIFEAVMISTSGQQGLSFTTSSVDL